MTKLTNQNIINRKSWLERITSGEICDIKLMPHLSNMRNFCKFSLDGEFTSISLNSLKNNCHRIIPPTHEKNGWLVFIELTKSAHSKLDALSNEPHNPSDLSAHTLLQQLKIAHLMANECYLHFSWLVKQLEIFRQQSNLTDTIDKQKLVRLIAKANCQLEILRSHELSKPELRIVRAQKP